MGKKDFVIIAKAVRDLDIVVPNLTVEQHTSIIQHFLNVISVHPRFDTEKFIKATTKEVAAEKEYNMDFISALYSTYEL